jgi:hypothetical protein
VEENVTYRLETYTVPVSTNIFLCAWATYSLSAERRASAIQRDSRQQHEVNTTDPTRNLMDS